MQLFILPYFGFIRPSVQGNTITDNTTLKNLMDGWTDGRMEG